MSELEGLILTREEGEQYRGRARGSGEFPSDPSHETYRTRTPRIVGLAGKMGVGKDTVAAMLRMRGYQRRGFAEPLREELVVALESRTAPRGMRPDMAVLVRSGRFTRQSVYHKPTANKMRSLLQYWGTELRRAEDPEYWIKKMDLSGGGLYVVSDLRFANEADYVRSLGGQVWMITGRQAGWGARTGDGHESEKCDLVADVTIDNSGAMYELAEKVIEALGE